MKLLITRLPSGNKDYFLLMLMDDRIVVVRRDETVQVCCVIPDLDVGRCLIGTDGGPIIESPNSLTPSMSVSV